MAARVLGLGSAGFLLLMIAGNHKDASANLWLIGSAIVLIAIFAVDWAMRRNGLRR